LIATVPEVDQRVHGNANFSGQPIDGDALIIEDASK
jgi:hypothetical protein